MLYSVSIPAREHSTAHVDAKIEIFSRIMAIIVPEIFISVSFKVPLRRKSSIQF